jgi:hypothetical protein
MPVSEMSDALGLSEDRFVGRDLSRLVGEMLSETPLTEQGEQRCEQGQRQSRDDISDCLMFGGWLGGTPFRLTNQRVGIKARSGPGQCTEYFVAK